MSDSTIKQAQSIGFDLDGVSVVARGGESILKAAQRAGHDIPHLCYSDGLRADGNCRACVVEIDGERALAPSCCRQPTEGMVVYSNNARARQSQALVLELLKTDVGDAKFTGTSELDQWCDRPHWNQKPVDLIHYYIVTSWNIGCNDREAACGSL